MQYLYALTTCPPDDVAPGNGFARKCADMVRRGFKGRLPFLRPHRRYPDVIATFIDDEGNAVSLRAPWRKMRRLLLRATPMRHRRRRPKDGSTHHEAISKDDIERMFRDLKAGFEEGVQ